MHTIGRFAPSPSGRMHLGNVLCALLAWLSARQQNGEFLLRIEDLDEMRCPRSFADLIIDDLRWLGLDWDGENPVSVRAHGCLREIRGDSARKRSAVPVLLLESGPARRKRAAPVGRQGGLRRNLPRFNTRASGRKAQKACACNARARARAAPSRSRTACTASILKRSPRSAATSSSGGRTACSRISWRSWWMTACPA